MDDNDQHLKREETLQRSLRECTTRRLTHFNPCTLKRVHNAPTLTSHVQWSTSRSQSQNIHVRDTSCSVKSTGDDGQEASYSPEPSEMDQLDQLEPSEYANAVDPPVFQLTIMFPPSISDEQPQPDSRPPTGASSASRPLYGYRKNLSTSDDTYSSRSYTDSSDTERRQPSFPGNRDIIDNRFLSASPSPPTQHSAELETPSPLSDIPCGWEQSSASKSSASLDLRLNPNGQPSSRNDRLDRVGSWRVESLRSGSGRESPHYERYGPERLALHGMSRNTRSAYSPSIATSSAPSSPRPVLPPIHHLNATLPVNTGTTPGVMHWRFREPADAHDLKRLNPAYRGPADDYDDGRSPSASPHSLPPLLPMIEQGYSVHRPVSPMVPMPAAPPSPPVANPTRDKNAWKDYAQLVSGPNEQTEFRCVWRVAFAGESTDNCGYTAKRHLVKRHIETRHLQFKDHICPYCGKAFPQRVSLMIHVNRHTGAKPHPCRYVDCDKTFSDPARRHKHMVETHGYNPQGPRKRHRTVDSYHANASFETLAPWTAKDEDLEDAVHNA